MATRETTIGARLVFHREAEMTTTLGILAEALETSARRPMSTTVLAIMMLARASAIAAALSVTESLGTRSPGTLNCHADRSENSFATETVITLCEAPSRARWRRSALFEWSPVVISETTMMAPPTCDQATCVTCARKG
jgi:hypothetical protein